MTSRDEYVAAMKSAFISLGTRLAQGWAVSLAPFLANWVFQKIIEAAARSLFTFLANNTEMSVFFLYIDTRVNKQARGFEAAARENFKVQTDPKASAQEKKDAEEKLWSEFEPFARLDM